MKSQQVHKNSIGKGLKELLQENEYALDHEVIVEVPLDDIKTNPYQPRYIFNDEKISELAASIAKHGVFQPIIVKKMNNHYSIVAGERRFRACKLLDFKTIPAIVRMYEKDRMIQIALIENLQRENLSAIEEARGYLQMIRQLGITQREVADRVAKSRSHVTNMLGLLNLPEEIIESVDAGKISMGHARVLSKLNDENRIIELANLIIAQGLSVRDIEEIAKQKFKPTKTDAEVKLEIQLEAIKTKLFTKYKIETVVKNNKITIKAPDNQKVMELLEMLAGK